MILDRINSAFLTLDHGLEEYREAAASILNPEQTQIFGSIRRRSNQCRISIGEVQVIHGRLEYFAFAMLKAFNRSDHAEIERLMGHSSNDLDKAILHAEHFYWSAHKAIDSVIVKEKHFAGKRLPGMPGKFPHGGVTLVRNHLMAHPFLYNETYSLGGRDTGPVLAGGSGRDANGNLVVDRGLYINAEEWLESMIAIVSAATRSLSACD